MPKYKDDARIHSFREMIGYLREDYRVNDFSLLRPGMQAMIMYRFGVWQMSLRRSLLRWFAFQLFRIMHAWSRNFYGIELYATARIGRRLRIAHQSGIVLHPELVMGDDCLIRQGVSIGRAANHGEGIRARAPVIGNRVEVGTGAVIAGGITIGDDVVIGPNAVVLRSVPAGSIVTVPPSRIMSRPPRRQAGAEAHQPAAPAEVPEPSENAERAIG